jgi:hypothetical protein
MVSLREWERGFEEPVEKRDSDANIGHSLPGVGRRHEIVFDLFLFFFATSGVSVVRYCTLVRWFPN